MTAQYLAYSTYPVKAGDRVLIHAAAGGVGRLLVQMAKNLGAFVIACLSNGLVLLGAQATESNIYLGVAIIAAMILNVQLDAVRVRRKR